MLPPGARQASLVTTPPQHVTIYISTRERHPFQYIPFNSDGESFEGVLYELQSLFMFADVHIINSDHHISYTQTPVLCCFTSRRNLKQIG